MRASALLAFLVLVPTASADISGPTTVTAKVGRLSTITLTTDCDETDYAVLGDVVDGFREFEQDAKRIKLRVIGYEPGTAYLVAWGTKAGKLIPKHVVTITVGGGPTPPVPPPVPPPAPVDPISPLAKALKDAAKVDNWPAAQLRELAIGFGVCANVTTAGKTASALEQARAKALASAVPDGVPASVYAVCAAKQAAVNVFLPISDPEHVVTADEAAKVKAIYTELADACREAAK